MKQISISVCLLSLNVLFQELEKYIHSSTKRGSNQSWQCQDFESFWNGRSFFKSRECPVLPNGNFSMELSKNVCGTEEFPKVFAIFASELEMINAFSKPATQILCFRNVSWIWNWIACKLLKDYKDAVLVVQSHLGSYTFVTSNKKKSRLLR